MKKKEAHPGGEEESFTQFRTPTNVSLDKKEADQGKQEDFAQFRTPTNGFRRLPGQVYLQTFYKTIILNISFPPPIVVVSLQAFLHHR